MTHRGTPVIHGTRISVDLIQRKLDEGATAEDVLDAYPRRTPEDVFAAARYGAERLDRG